MKNKIIIANLLFSISSIFSITQNFKNIINEAKQKISIAKDTKEKINELNHLRGPATIQNKDRYVQQLQQKLYEQTSAARKILNAASTLAKTSTQHNEVEKLFIELDKID